MKVDRDKERFCVLDQTKNQENKKTISELTSKDSKVSAINPVGCFVAKSNLLILVKL